MMNWDTYRRPDGSIDIVQAWQAAPDHKYSTPGENLLYALEDLQPVTSRQIAALAISIANSISELREVPE